MSKTTIETTITRGYLRGKSKDEIIEHVMRLLDENEAWAGHVAYYVHDNQRVVMGLRRIHDWLNERCGGSCQAGHVVTSDNCGPCDICCERKAIEAILDAAAFLGQPAEGEGRVP